MRSLAKLIAINLAVVVFLAAALEGASWAVLKLNDLRISGWQVADLRRDADNALSSVRFLSSPGVARDQATQIGPGSNAFVYEPFLVYKTRPFRSEFFNVGNNGFRSNGQRFAKPTADKYVIWVFGSSALYGVYNADNETLPAQIERVLNERHPNVLVEVQNRGTIGYVSLQDALAFQQGLWQSTPDMVITFNGANDIFFMFNASLAGFDPGKPYVVPGVNAEALSYYWEFHGREGVVNWPMLLRHVLGMFPNTTEVLHKASRLGQRLAGGRDLEAFKEEYQARARQQNALLRQAAPLVLDAFVVNQRAIADLANGLGIKTIMMQQPTLFVTTKPLVRGEDNDEVAQAEHFLATTARPDAELAALTELAPYDVDKKGYWDREFFRDTYRRQNAMLRNLAVETGASYIDMQALVDAAGDMPVFLSPIHYSHFAFDRMAHVIADKVDEVTDGLRERPARR